MKKSNIKYIAPLVCLLFAVWYLHGNQNVSVETLLAFAPEKPAKAMITMLVLFALKSATVFFPLIILEITVGHLFSPWAALGINFTGILIILTIPYFVGKAAGIDAIRKIVKKYPRFREIIEKQQDNSLFLCFFLRIISCLPGDVVTMYLGATRTPYRQNLFAGLLGLTPKMILATLMGSSIQDPQSPAFWISATLIVMLAVMSIILYQAYRRKIQRKSNNEE